jgi:hypothetical protein
VRLVPRRQDGAGEQSGAAEGLRRPSPPARPRELRRERKALLALRERRLRDLGGLTLEMYKRDRFNAGLVLERCAELVAIEARVQEIGALLLGDPGSLGSVRATCICGAPVLLGARFCPSCGRRVGGAAAEDGGEPGP